MTLLVIAALQLLQLHWQVETAGLASVAVLLLFLATVATSLGLRERVLLGMCAAATIVAVTITANPWPLLLKGGTQASFLTAFLVLLALLRDGASTSRSVGELGRYLTSRPPGKRYIAIHAGSQLLGMFLNFGALTLLGPLIQRGARTGTEDNSALAQWRERRQLSALARGFSWTICWSPATVSMAITLSVVTDARLWMVCLCGLLSANVGSFLIGWRLDRNSGAQARMELTQTRIGITATPANLPFPRRAANRLLLVCLALFGTSVVVSQINGVRVIAALMLVSPFVMFAWVLMQRCAPNPSVSSLRVRLHSIVLRSVPAGTPEAVTLAAAGFLGVVVAGLTDPDLLAASMPILRDSNPLIYVLAMAAIPIASNFALPSIMTVTFLGSLLSSLPEGRLHPDLIACALLWGWGLNLTASPFGGVPLILGRITGIPSRVLSWHWNGWFSILLFIWCSAALVGLSHLLD